MDSESKFGKNFWIGVASIVFAGIVITVVTLLVTPYFAKSPDLLYTILPANVVSVDGNSSAVYAMHLRNGGKTMAKNVKLTVSVPSSSISKFSVNAPPNIVSNKSQTGSSLEVDLPTLNASEAIDIQFQADRIGPLPNRPDVSIRGEDVIDKEERPSYFILSWPYFLFSGLSVLFTGGVVWQVIKIRRLQRDDRSIMLKQVADLKRDVGEIIDDGLMKPRFILA